MMTSEKRTILVFVSGVDTDFSEQVAIPWCTAHNDMASWDALDEQCWARSHQGPGEGECVISMGGPDHKWWKDASTG